LPFFFGTRMKYSWIIRRLASGSYDPNSASTIGKNHSPEALAIVGVPITSGSFSFLKIRSALAASSWNRSNLGTSDAPAIIRLSQSLQLVSQSGLNSIS
jgi:hypothetical protein